MTQTPTFKTPSGMELPFLILKGKHYLQVAHRIQWFVSEKPNWSITSRIVERTDNNLVIMEANILDESGKLRASAHKVGQFGIKFLEVAETGAVGRALAFLGYGTQFAEDLFDEEDDIADAPVSPKANPHNLPKLENKPSPPVIKSQAPSGKPRNLSEAQVKRLWAIAKANNYSNADVFAMIKECRVENEFELSKKNYEEICDYLQQGPPPPAQEEEIEPPF